MIASHGVVTMGGIDVIITYNDRPTTRICQKIANFDNYGANYRSTVFEDSIKLVDASHISNYGGLRIIALCDDTGI